MTATAEELARLTGLDAPTISEQVLPHLDSYNAPEPLRLYLESLVGTGPAARSFILNYLTAKFGPAHHRSIASASQPPSRPASSTGSALSSRPQSSSSSRHASQNNNNKGKERQISEEDAMAALNPAERDAVDEIDRGLKLLSLPASHPILQKLKCFCQGRRHPLSNYVRLCRSCGLLLCTLNMPTQPCPSCAATGGPLLTGSALLAHKTAQLNRRESYLAEGRERFALALQVENEERARMSFPSLAERANGMDEVQQRIQRAYGQEDHARRVLTLDLKNKKVSTKKSQPKKPVQAAGGVAAAGTATPADLERELGLDRIQGWIDVRDDGFRKQVKEGKAAPVPSAPAPSIIHYVPRDQDESLAEPEEEDADEDETEDADETEESTKPSTGTNTPATADQDSLAQETAADGGKGSSSGQSRSQSSKGKGRSRGNKGRKAAAAIPGMSAGDSSANAS